MNEIKITRDFILYKLTLPQLSQRYDASIPEVIRAITKFVKNCRFSWTYKVKCRLKLEVLRMFLCSHLELSEFAIKLGTSERTFFDFIKEVIEDRNLIPDNSVANAIYVKAMEHKQIKYRFVPDRIVQYIAYLYVKDKHITQASIGGFYGISDTTIGKILRRGIAEDIIDEDTADKIFAKVRTCYHNGTSETVLNSYLSAFDSRVQAQHNKAQLKSNNQTA